MKKLVGSLTIGILALSFAPQAKACSSMAIGSTTFHNCGSLSGSSTTIGNTTFHNFGNRSGTSSRIGSFTFHNFSD